ncbi:MAG TPA: DNA polymerase III subunit alpha, partial [Candidatus Omnitrophota bacterium]|nr:DNA polymerase III subunit alpha [Candidatus Omnitrophota bacterium]
MQHSHFVHLHVHTQFSLLDGACKIPELIALAKEYRMPAVALTDHGNMFGAIEFYIEAMKNGIKPIIGCEIYVAPGSRLDKSASAGEESAYHLILLSKDEEGYRNLMKLVSAGYLEGFYYKPRVDKELLARYSKGLIAQSACLQGEIPYLIVKGKYEEAKVVAGQYKDIFGPGNFYLELQKNLIPEQETANAGLLKLSKELDIPLVATGDVHYLRKRSSRAHEGLLCIQTQTTLSDPDHMRFSTDEFYFKSPEEFKELFSDVPQAISNTIEIAEKCNLELDFNKTHLPQFTPPEGRSREEYLKDLVEEGLKIRYAQVDKTIRDRVDHELNIIKKTGFTSYFLIAWDFINYAKSKNIPVGPGRGSAAGSVVSYSLGITDLDPIKYDLIFERFLNPDRVSLPDIDIDFCYERRGEVIEYVTQKYSKENVAQVITFGTMKARAVIRDVGRVMGISYGDVDRIAKLVPEELGITLEKALKVEPELRNMYKSDPQMRQLIDISTELEGLNRHASTHAAGVVISDLPLTDYVPLFKTSEGQLSTGYEMKSLEKIGLLKMDFLGLRTLTVIDETVKIIKRTKGLALDINNIPLDDKKTYDLLSNSESLGIFQLESSGMRDILR